MKIDWKEKYNLTWLLNILEDVQPEFEDIIRILKIILNPSSTAKAIQNEIPRLEKLIESQDFQAADAAYLLGVLYRLGLGVTKDYARAFKYFNLLLHEEEIVPTTRPNELGMCYKLGLGVEKNPKKAAEFFQLAANHDWIPAVFNLGKCFELGQGVRKDLKVAYEYYERAARGGYARAETVIALFHTNGWIDPPKKSEEVFELYRAAALKEDFAAKAYLGSAYLYGLGTPKNIEKGLLTLQEALAEGSEEAQFYLAGTYSNDPEVRISTDFKREKELLTLSAAQGDVYSVYTLGMFYLTQDGFNPDLHRVVLLFAAAAQRGYGEAVKELVSLGYKKEALPKLNDLMEQYSKQHFQHQDSTILAFCYQMGFGTAGPEEDLKQAEKLFNKTLEFYKEKLNKEKDGRKAKGDVEVKDSMEVKEGTEAKQKMEEQGNILKKGYREAISQIHWDLYLCYRLQKQMGIDPEGVGLNAFYEVLNASVQDGNKFDLDLLGFMNEQTDINLERNWYFAVNCYHQFCEYFKQEADSVQETDSIQVQKIGHVKDKIRCFTPLLDLQTRIQDLTNLNPSISALIVSYMVNTDVQKDIKLS